MAFVVWNVEAKIGFDSLDNEHWELCKSINELHETLTVPGLEGEAGVRLEKLVDATRAHFASEESMMTRYGYPGLTLHFMKHEHLQKQADALLVRFKRGGFKLDEYALVFLREWFTMHIQKDDRNFCAWLREHAGRL